MRAILLAICLTAAAPLWADPLLVKGADGSFLPILAEQWQPKGGGVYFRLKKGLDPVALKEKLAEKFPDQSIETRAGQIFFASVELDALLSSLAGIDTGITLAQDPLTLLRQKKDAAEEVLLPADQRTGQTADLALVEVAAISFSALDGLVKIDAVVQTTPTEGEFSQLKGTIKAKIFFKMKKKRVDPADEENRRKSDALLVQSGSLLYLRIDKKESDDTYLVTETRLKKY